MEREVENLKVAFMVADLFSTMVAHYLKTL